MSEEQDFAPRIRFVFTALLALAALTICAGMGLSVWRSSAQQAQLHYAAAGAVLETIPHNGCENAAYKAKLDQAESLVLQALRADAFEAKFWLRSALIAFCQQGAQDARGYMSLDIARRLDPDLSQIKPQLLLRSLSEKREP